MRPSRRSFLLGAAALAACHPATGPASPAAPSAKKRILILGGTNFLGPQLVELLRARGHALTLFNRGKTNPHLFPDLEKLHGDRKTGDLASLRGRTWDVVIDDSAYVPRAVRESTTLLATAEQYVIVSSVSVYDKPSKAGVDETSPLAKLADPTTEKVDEATYGGLKAACERTAQEVMPGRVTVVRPGLIVGPGDPTDRFTYWPVRVAEGGEVLAPGTPADPVQVIDVRDQAAWIVAAIENRYLGTYNTVGPAAPIGIGAMLEQARAASGSAATFTWVDAAFLEKNGVKAWDDVPVWVSPFDEDAGMARVSSARAIAKGLSFRPLGETMKDTLAWWRSLPEERRAKPKAGMTRAREAEVLAAFKKK